MDILVEDIHANQVLVSSYDRRMIPHPALLIRGQTMGRSPLTLLSGCHYPLPLEKILPQQQALAVSMGPARQIQIEPQPRP